MKGSKTQSWQLVGGSYFSYLFFPLFMLGAIYRGVWWLLPASLVLIVVPVLDSIAGEDLTPDELTLSRSQKWLLEAAPVLFVLGNAAVICLGAHAFAGLPAREKLFVVLSVGMIGSIGITAAHELVHKPHKTSKIFGRIGLANVCYLHFEINHIQGHHVRVGTKDDQSTAWFGESFYEFLFRTVPGCFKLSWELERQQMNRRRAATLPPRNQMIQFTLFQAVYIAIIWYLGGWFSIAFFISQAAVAICMLEATAYIEHYGLLRSKRADGKYEPMSPANSWDCYGRFSNYLAFQLQRHADHHAYPTRAFSNLHTATDAPKLPVGYPWLIGMAMVPPLWRRIMDPRVKATKVARRQIQPIGEGNYSAN
ncbi:MAG: alkane 1-monooxygenase [Candidatus Acidiferrales bacterium]